MISFFNRREVPQINLFDFIGAQVEDDKGRVGYVHSIGISPNHTEEVSRIIRVQVRSLPDSSESWLEYWLLEDISEIH